MTSRRRPTAIGGIGSATCTSDAAMANPDDPLALFQLLARAGVPFVIIGGHAVTFHGFIANRIRASRARKTTLPTRYRRHSRLGSRQRR